MMRMRAEQQKEDKVFAETQREQFLINMKNKRDEERARTDRERAEMREKVKL